MVSSRGFRVGATAAILVASVLTACTDSSSSSGGGGVLNATLGSTGSFVANFNPYSPSFQVPTNGMIYEPLFYFNTVKAGQIEPWLGTKYTWSQGGKQLDITVRSGVKWSDGQPMTNKDVAFTFGLAHSNTALNTYGVPYRSVSTTGTAGVRLTFTEPAYQDLYYIAGKTDILPAHIWSKVSDKTKFQNAKPVGTGAYTVKSVSAQVLTMSANPKYYVKGLPHFKTIRFRAFNSNTSTDAAVENGSIDWGGGFIPDINKNYLAKNKHFALVNLPLATGFLLPNYQRGPTQDLAVRQAMNVAMDRNFISRTVYNGQTQPSNPMALLRPNFDSYLDPSLANQKLTYNTAKAKSILKSAGYTLGSDGIFSKNGKRLTVTIQTIAGYTDYASILQIVQQQMRKAGIDVQVKSEAYQQFNSNQYAGNFDVLIEGVGFTPNPYSYYGQLMDSSITKPIGTVTTAGNFGRYRNPQADALFRRLRNTADPAVQKQAIYQLQRLFIATVPAIPITEAQNEIEFNGNHVQGYPSKTDPYASAAIYVQPDIGWVAARIKPAG
jgi:peptide/nickel transport system substrate-binding protein